MSGGNVEVGGRQACVAVLEFRQSGVTERPFESVQDFQDCF